MPFLATAFYEAFAAMGKQIAVHLYSSLSSPTEALRMHLLQPHLLFRSIHAVLPETMIAGSFVSTLTKQRLALQQNALRVLLRQCTGLLRWVHAEMAIAGSAEHLLFELLHQPWFGCPANALVAASMQAYAHRPTRTLSAEILHPRPVQVLSLFDAPPATSALRAAVETLHTWRLSLQEGQPFSAPFMMQSLGIATHLQNICEAHQASVLKSGLAAALQLCWDQLLTPGNPSKISDAWMTEQAAILENALAASMVLSTVWPASETAMENAFLRVLTPDESLIHLLRSASESHQQIDIVSIDDPDQLVQLKAKLAHAGLPMPVVHKHKSGLDAFAQSEAAPVLRLPVNALMEKTVKMLRINASNLNAFLDCKLRFYYQSIVRVPSGQNAAASFGTAVHTALEKAFAKDTAGGWPVATEQQVLVWFTEAMHTLRAQFLPGAFAEKLAYGQQILPGFYRHHLATATPVAAVEKSFRTVLPAGTPVNGKMDKIEYRNGSATIVDYKTGSFQRAWPQLQPPSATQPLGGAYWRQAVFYRLLYTITDHRPVSAIHFAFVEPVEGLGYPLEKVQVSPADTEMISALATQVYQQIQNFDFATGCGRQSCHWCRFVRDHALYKQ